MLRFRNRTEACKAYEAIFVLLDISSEALPTLSGLLTTIRERCGTTRGVQWEA